MKEGEKLLEVERLVYCSDSFFLDEEFLLDGIKTLLDTSMDAVLLDFFIISDSVSIPSPYLSEMISTFISSILLLLKSEILFESYYC
jgi:hypothetical protein